MKILVIDDHVLVREGLKQVLRTLEDNVEVFLVGTCAQGFSVALEHPDLELVLLDYHLPDMNGLDALRIFSRRHPDIPVLILSGSSNPQIMHQVLQAGAAGYSTKTSVSEELLGAVRCVLAGDIYMPPPAAQTFDQDYPAPATAPMPLSPKQEQVLCELLAGRSNPDIARLLSISEETVKTHMAAILRHFNVQNRTQAVVAATRCGYRATAKS
ncbi:response regulator transcription factor [Curvibacter sp. APW13]|uniref:response regulator transcription factor n=1 Tax=Curvibacter sp. APW13 TaxID=3077236 RepID=UPI0028DFBEF3|nr:response regulator transcription factor [Curvibacter sp. APW13]MDT8992235.1 response regulator transcription factor [Curvibacter sp. APW13]